MLGLIDRDSGCCANRSEAPQGTAILASGAAGVRETLCNVTGPDGLNTFSLQ
jgi:hypothetical protein